MDNNFDQQFTPSYKVKRNSKLPGPVAAGMFFTITTILLTYGGIILPIENDFLRSGLGEVLFILLPVLLFLILGKYNIKDTLKLRKPKPINYLIVPALMLTVLPIVAVLNAATLGLIRLIFGKNLPVEQISVPDVPTLIIAFLVVGVSAAICEEVLFRGLISKSYEVYGAITSLIFTSILFGILHRDIQKCVSTIVLGVLIGFIVYKTKSIYAGMIAHFTNNVFIVLLLFSTSKSLEQFEKYGNDPINNFDFSSVPLISWVIVIIFYAMLFLGSVAVFSALMYAFCRVNKTENQAIKNINVEAIDGNETLGENNIIIASDTTKTQKFSLSAFIAILPGLILIILTFTGDLLKLMNIDSGLLYDFLKTLWLIRPD